MTGPSAIIPVKTKLLHTERAGQSVPGLNVQDTGLIKPALQPDTRWIKLRLKTQKQPMLI
ncbi:hypothetical protein SAMN05216326_102115 [Nitrosomonas marina]|uniref:Uncharacterized protein n=1 Tax=Nitrosomonas marina TaxID=917 RepID=A0A1H9YQI1_9PROT|nr:hypothetical protein [Nitrosomonas marina]SES71309.1 hypothetical protein SAMN05216326_102115 [Nitrosomonas marina]